jgi:hypothetical protein
MGMLAGNQAEHVRDRSPDAYFQTQVVDGHKVEVSISTAGRAIATIDGDCNFFADAKSFQDLSDFLLTVTTFPIQRK